MKKIVAILLCVMLITSFAGLQGLCVSADANTNKTVAEETTFTNGELLKEIALAYDRQGEQMLYDQLNARRSIYSSPEDATAQRTIFLDCSSYVNSCYREAFGVNILPFEIGETGTSPSTANYDEYAKNNQSASDVVGYWMPADYTTDAERQALANKIYKEIQIGDILTYRHGNPTSTTTSGHVYMYLGESTFIHCAGAGSYIVNTSNPALSYDANAGEVKSSGTIGTISLFTIFEDSTSARYIFKATDSDTVKSFSILRPMVRGLTPTEEAVNRMKIAGLSMEKTSSVCENSAVDTGDIITYKVTLENTNSQELSSVEITDTLPTGTDFVSGDSGVTLAGNRLVWNGNVPAKSTVEVKYSVKITENIPGALIVSDATYVSGVKLGNITHSVSGFSKTQRALIGNAAHKLACDSHKFADGLEMVRFLYKSTLDVNLSNYTNCEAMLDQLIDTDSKTRNYSTEISKVVAPNLYGGLDIRYGWLYLESENDKTRLPKEEHLSIGDIILADWDEGNNVYVYAGNKTLVTVENGGCKALAIGDDIYTPGDNILISLLGYNRYAVLRPSMSSTVPVVEASSIEVTTLPDKLSYYSGEKFDSEGMVVNAILNNGQSVEISNYTVSPEKAAYPNKSINVEYGKLKATVDVDIRQEEKITVVVNGTVLETSVNPKITNDRALVPMDALFESLDIYAEWNPATNTVTAKNEFREVSVTADSNIAKVNDKEVLMEASPRIYEETVLVPIRFIAESFSAGVDWIAAEKNVVLTGGKVIYPPKHEGAIGIYNIIQSGDDGNGRIINNALDGDISTYWGVSRNDPNGAYGIFDFGFPKNIKSVVMAFSHGAKRVYTFDILVSDDGINFTPAVEGLQSSGTTLELEEFEVNARGRFAKIVGHGHKDGVWNSYSEIAFIENKD